MLKIAKLGNPILRKIAAPIDPREIRSSEVQGLIDDHRVGRRIDLSAVAGGQDGGLGQARHTPPEFGQGMVHLIVGIGELTANIQRRSVVIQAQSPDCHAGILKSVQWNYRPTFGKGWNG